MFKKLQEYILKYPVAILLTYGILIRLLVFVFYHHVSIFPDSEDYTNLAQYLLNFSLENYTGERTPGLPFLIALVGGNLYLTVLIQTLLGILSLYLIYDFSKTKTGNVLLAFWITIITTSFLHFVFFEFAILTETLSMFFLFLSFWYLQKYEVLKSTTPLKHYLVLSVILSVLYLVRPMFIYVPIGFSLFYLVKNFNFGIKKILIKTLAISLLPLVTFYNWCSLNERNIGQFTSSYYLGMNFAQVATSFFEKAPEEDKLIRDVFVAQRKYTRDNLPYHLYPMTAWFAYNQLIEETDYTRLELINEMGRISKELIKNNPDLYAKQVVISFRDFWFTSSLLWNVNEFQNVTIKKSLIGLWNYLEHYLLILINTLFLLFSIKKLFYFFKMKCQVFDLDLLIVAIVLSGALAQALVTYGSNSRFSFPYFPLIVYFVLVNVMTLKNNYAKRTLS
ncbi:hypothetical protein [Bizionia arctica]|uniref:Glycosyltransferase RgtA/B/C/D-like domain-containing protein n=1 Tax=Bizionia arctica TaxID=1495645 RepID=A0A917LSP9_9FLAO|nr:hypothetical protein [Bizionia arctica]GGG54653.1 hypothetical protein GCM10010976_26990 [Bizionia arctica]